MLLKRRHYNIMIFIVQSNQTDWTASSIIALNLLLSYGDVNEYKIIDGELN